VTFTGPDLRIWPKAHSLIEIKNTRFINLTFNVFFF